MKRLIAIATLLLSFTVCADESDLGNVRFDPLNLIFSSVDLDLDFKIAQDWTLGPAGAYAHYGISSNSAFTESYMVTAWSLGARANWFYNGAYTSGFYVGPSIKYESIKVTTADSIGPVTGTASPVLVGAVAGYGWFWDHFNIMLGGGLEMSLGSTNITIQDSQGNSYTVYNEVAGLLLEATVGWTF